MRAPSGLYPGELYLSGGRVGTGKFYRATGEYRPPRKGEFFLSGAEITAYRAPNDLGSSYWIARPVKLGPCPHCKGTGKVEVL